MPHTEPKREAIEAELATALMEFTVWSEGDRADAGTGRQSGAVAGRLGGCSHTGGVPTQAAGVFGDDVPEEMTSKFRLKED